MESVNNHMQVEAPQGGTANHRPTQQHPPGTHANRAQPYHDLEDLLIATCIQKARTFLGVRVSISPVAWSTSWMLVHFETPDLRFWTCASFGARLSYNLVK